MQKYIQNGYCFLFCHSCTHLTAVLSSCFGVLYDVLKCQSSIEHHRLLARNHLTIDGIVEVGNLERRECFSFFNFRAGEPGARL